MRLLVASPLGNLIEPTLSASFPAAKVIVARDRAEVVHAVPGIEKLDVVLADLVWNDPEQEFRFDGLDVLDMVRESRAGTAVLLAGQGHSMEQDHLDEAYHRADEIVGVHEKATGIAALLSAIRQAADGERLPNRRATKSIPSLYELFTGRDGVIAGRLAGAIASGHTWDPASLAAAAEVDLDAAHSLADGYLGRIIAQRRENESHGELTAAVVYRWCGLHARYLISWCRRNGHTEVLTHGDES
ncbi:MSMEG_1198 family transcriptional regulator [Nocardia gamkensis]|uniref:response regulator n=1 Tax=Nocardia gamkensis TaxID=352869 RepID=UPI0037C4F1A4